ncbi:TetR/AcrR family transcriptional regulator [Rhodobacteraceae bacterium 63075]|nr:TetR/AcrR family transcriptional regulator [Rhodobacteraceae bacterium 63075]
MTSLQAREYKRKRAPSQRSLATRQRILDAAEQVFADRGFDGATIRDIAELADEPVGLVHHHGGGKKNLFQQTVVRRAEALSCARMNALDSAREQGALTLEAVLSAFVRPLFDLAMTEPRWRSYAHLVAFVSTDKRWKDISARHFDPTAQVFMEEMRGLLPQASRPWVAESFVYCVSSTLALMTSQQRIASLSAEPSYEADQIAHLVRFCAAGLHA